MKIYFNQVHRAHDKPGRVFNIIFGELQGSCAFGDQKTVLNIDGYRDGNVPCYAVYRKLSRKVKAKGLFFCCSSSAPGLVPVLSLQMYR